MRQFRKLYGSGPLHLLTMLISLAVAAYTISRLGIGVLWDTDVWWQSIAVWFLPAAVVHDLVLFPAYAPGIIEQGTGSFLRATGQTQDPFLAR